MQKVSSRPVLRAGVVAAAFIMSAACAGQALAECDEDQEALVGKAIATAATAKVSQAVAVQGKQMVNIDVCDISGGTLVVTYKYNFLGADGLYWVQGSAKVKGTDVVDLKVDRMSPNLTAASAAKGVKLASN